jgi:hypothetical protein
MTVPAAEVRYAVSRVRGWNPEELVIVAYQNEGPRVGLIDWISAPMTETAVREFLAAAGVDDAETERQIAAGKQSAV